MGSRLTSRELLAMLGLAVVLYSVTLLEFVAISPDLRVRTFLANSEPATQDGVEIQRTIGLRWKSGQTPPREGDLLQYVNRIPTPTLLDFFHAVDGLYNPDELSIDKVNAPDSPMDWKPENVSGLVQEFDERGPRRRLVEVLYRSQATDRVEYCWVEIQSVPPGGIVLSFLWLVPHLGILLIGGAAFWQRPFDRSARLFYVMCVVTIGAYMGGFHWWTIATSPLLTMPFIICGTLLPAVTLHFFLVYPRPIPWAVTRPRTMLALIYTLPTLGIAVGLLLLFYSGWLDVVSSRGTAVAVSRKVAVLTALRVSVDVYLIAAACFYAATLAALVRSGLTVRDPAEKAQVRWILAAAIAATFPVGYTIWLAATDRTEFAFGGARWPMFFASFGFLLAYAVGMVRYRLLLADEVIGKGVRYYVARASLTILVALGLAAIGFWAGAWDVWLPQPQSAAVVAAIIILAVTLLLIIRDRLQQELDRRFFSEKYQLGATLRGVHAAAEQLTDESDLGQQVVESCREVLEVTRAAVYRRTDAELPQYRRSAAIGDDFPETLDLSMLPPGSLTEGASVQRVLAGLRGELSPAQALLRQLDVQLLHTPPTRGALSTLLLLGPKPNDAVFTAEDLTFLSALGHVTDVALQGVGSQRLHRKLADELGRAEEALAGQARQIAVLQAELTELHRRQGTGATIVTGDEFRREIIRGESPAISSVLETVRKVAGSDATVMIRGESGTGKELLAQVIHDNSPRREKPLVRVHCAALSPTLLESELFGHVKGAFTGADRDKVGRFQLADGGTLFLDEIGEISPEIQVKLLRVLQERCFEPVGSSHTVSVDVRLITATNRNLEEMIVDAEFREDLYYRLNVITVTLPPLRERAEDVYDLAFTFLHQAARRTGKSVVRFEDAVLSVLSRYHWPGNVRELQNVVERAVVLADGDTITLADLPAELSDPSSTSSAARDVSLRAPRDHRRKSRKVSRPKPKGRNRVIESTAQDFSEKERLVAALNKAEGNKAEAARLLELPRSTLFSKLKKYGLK